MDLIEFFERTDHRNLIHNINNLVKQRLRERDEELEERKARLYAILESENLQYEQEIELLMRQHREEQTRKRIDWIRTMRLEREIAEQDFLQQKNMQRQLENSEEFRELESKELLLDTKKAQCYQIVEKKARCHKEQQIEAQWLEALNRLNKDQDRQQVYERKLQKTLADMAQEKNTQNDELQKQRIKVDRESTQSQHAEDNERACYVEQKYREAEYKRTKHKMQAHTAELQAQIEQNQQNNRILKELAFLEGISVKQHEDEALVQQLNEKIGQRIRNREWHKGYLEHTRNEKQLARDKQKELDALLQGKGCVLQQRKKQPYGKEVR